MIFTRRALGVVAAAGVLGGLGVYSYDPRTSRCLYNMAFIAADFKYTWWMTSDLAPEDQKFVNDELHQRSAFRILRFLEKNKGLYIKVGQHISTLNHVLPKQYTETMMALRDHAPTVDLATVEQVIFEDFGKSVHTLFQRFEGRPLAAASLAQVHEAVTRDGERVAVKVQFPRLRAQFDRDMNVHWAVLTAASWLFKGVDLVWIHDEVERSLRRELDFELEAANAERSAFNFAADVHVHVPKIFWSHTSKRVLTMEFIDGCRISEPEKIERLGLSVAACCASTVHALSSMIFSHGFVHCDPHPGNILVRQHPTRPGDHQIVLLDHGLYRELDEHTRLNYARFNHSLIMRDDETAARAARDLGVNNFDFFALSVLMRPYKGSMAGIGDGISRADVLKLRADLQGSQSSWVSFLKSLPPALLLVLRNQTYTRALCQELDNPVNRFRIAARAAWDGTYVTHLPITDRLHTDARKYRRLTEAHVSPWSLARWWSWLQLEAALAYADILAAAGTMYMRLLHAERWAYAQQLISEQSRAMLL